MNYSNVEGMMLREENQLMIQYDMFKYSIKSEMTRKFYERRLREFFDFIQFEPETTEIATRSTILHKEQKVIIVGRSIK
jgi:hypothetical protein